MSSELNYSMTKPQLRELIEFVRSYEIGSIKTEEALILLTDTDLVIIDWLCHQLPQESLKLLEEEGDITEL